MTTTRTRKSINRAYKEMKDSEAVKSFRMHRDISTKWYYPFLPKAVKDLIAKAALTALASEFGKVIRDEKIAYMEAELRTYRHNAQLQKEKSDKYAELRADRRHKMNQDLLEDNIPW